MNKMRRKQLQALSDNLDNIKEQIEALQGEEEEYRDNMPENMQNGEKYETAGAAIDALYSAVSSIEEAMSYITEATGD
jgi:flagellar biosynthesis chaperone FliJ